MIWYNWGVIHRTQNNCVKQWSMTVYDRGVVEWFMLIFEKK